MVQSHSMLVSLQKRRLALIVILFFVFGFLLFGSVLGHSFVSWDDKLLIVENINVHSMTPKTIATIFTTYDPELYVPLTLFTYQIECVLGGCASSLVHAVNLFLHILNSLLVAALLFVLLRRGWLAIGLGLLFLIHPLNVEAFAWASARKDVLSTFFFLLSLLLYLRSPREASRSENDIHESGMLFATRWFWYSVVCFLLGLLSKVMVITLPVLLLMLDWKRDGRLTLRSFTEKWPYWVLSLIFGSVALYGKTVVLAEMTPYQSVLMAAKSTSFYLQKFLVPTGLSVVYPFTGVFSATTSFFLIPIIVCITLLVLIALLYKRKSLVSIGLAFFLLTLFPTFTNFAKGDDLYFASDRYAYIPIIGLLLALGSLLSDWLHRAESIKTRQTRSSILTAAFLALFVTFGALAVRQTAVWKNGRNLYTHALTFYPKARTIQNNLGMVELSEGNIENAITRFDISLTLGDDPRVRANRAAALSELRGMLPEARKEFERALALDPTNKEIHYGLGNLSQKEEKYAQAIVHYKNALAIDPVYGNALNNLGAVYLLQSDWQNAILTLESLTLIRPTFVQALYNLGGVYHETGNAEKAKELYERVLALDPSDADAHASIATILYETGDIDGAAVHLQTVFDLNPANTIGHALLLRMRKDGVAE